MTAWLPALVVCLVSAPAFAGEIRGTVTVGGKSIGQGIAIEAHCGEQVHSTSTDKYGSYRVFLPENGTCQLQVLYQNQTPSREVISFDDSTRYDLALEKDGEQYVVRRK